MNKLHIKAAGCPECGRLLDGATMVAGEEGSLPQEGDYTVCVYCATPLVFTANFELRRLTPAEYEDMPAALSFVITICQSNREGGGTA